MKVFLDASVLFAGVYSPSGGSSAILKLIAHKKLKGFTSKMILKETEENIEEKLPTEVLLRYYYTISTTSLTILPEPDSATVRSYYAVIDPKDAHVLASFNQSQADYLVTLDKKYFFTQTVRQRFPGKIVSPKELLAIFTTHHSF